MTLGKLSKMPLYLRLIMFVLVAVVLCAGFRYLVTSSTRNETKELSKEIAELRARNALLPEQRELTMVLQGIQDRARNNGLVLRKFTPNKDDLQQENYSGKKIEVNVTSSFASLRAFFEQLAHYQRIVSITNFELHQSDKQSPTTTVEAKFDLIAYFVSAERLQKPASPQAAGSGGQASAPAVPQPAK